MLLCTGELGLNKQEFVYIHVHVQTFFIQLSAGNRAEEDPFL